MPSFLSPVDTVSSLALLVLALFGLVELMIVLSRNYYLNRRHLVILEVEPDLVKNRVAEFVGSLTPPIAFEIAIHHLGKDIHYYLIVPRKKSGEIVKRPGFKEVGDYELFHHGGEHLGAYLKGDSRLAEVNFEGIDFSRVNEVGEGVVVQMVFRRRRGHKLPMNFRVLVSAPSNYQAKEILATIKPSFSGLNMIESRGDEFISQVNFREFSDKEVVFWNGDG